MCQGGGPWADAHLPIRHLLPEEGWSCHRCVRTLNRMALPRGLFHAHLLQGALSCLWGSEPRMTPFSRDGFSEVWWTLSCGPACQTPWHAHMLPANAGKSGRLAALARLHPSRLLSPLTSRTSTLPFHPRCSFGSDSSPSPKAMQLRTDRQRGLRV